MQQRLRLASFAFSFVFGVTVTVALHAREAAAAACPSRVGNPYNSVASPDTNGRGVRDQGLVIENDPVQCIRVGSIGVNNLAGDTFVEVGWYEDPAGDISLGCVPNTGTSPNLLGYAVENGTIAGCYDSQTNVSGTDAFAVHDDNQNGRWTYIHEGGNFFNSPDLSPFVTGIIIAQGERFDLDDGAHTDHTSLQRMGASTTFSNWQGTAVNGPYDDDPDFFPCIHSNIHVEIQLNGHTCS